METLQTIFWSLAGVFKGLSKSLYRNGAIVMAGMFVVAVVSFNSKDFSAGGKNHVAHVASTQEKLSETQGSSDEEEDVMTVAQARSSAEKEDVWVSGYIVGGDLTSSSASFSGPFQSRTNLLLGPKSSTVSRDACVSVQLPSGEVRDALNLVDNPDVLRKRVCIKGDVVSAYYGIPGIKNTVEFQFIN